MDETERDISAGRLTHKNAIPVYGRDFSRKNSKIQRQFNAYAATGSRNVAETAQTDSQYTTSYSTLVQYMDLTGTVRPLRTTSGLGDTGNEVIRHRSMANNTLIFHTGPVEATSGLRKLLAVRRQPFPV